jgi:hypothetical protein
MNAPVFYLGTHKAAWLARTDVPLFVSRRTLAPMRSLPRARGRWALDSGGFTELALHGRWTVPAAQYAAEVRRFRDEIGGLAWAAPQDWMCEHQMLARTGLTVAEHQRRTTANLLELRAIAPEVPWIPVLQGWTLGDYLDHVEAYERAGVDLVGEPTVGVGTVCRRQSTLSVGNMLAMLAADGLRLHGFGFKVTGLRASGAHLVSADSLAWSMHARRREPIAGHTHKNCANCIEYALGWRDDLLASMARAA